MLDRRLVRDDGRGLGQGVMDNRPMNVVFHILVESNISTTLSSVSNPFPLMHNTSFYFYCFPNSNIFV